jgi:hypothetical protein
VRILLAALLAVGLSGAAWAAADAHSPGPACDVSRSADIDTDEITRTVEAALQDALAALDRERIDDATLAAIEADMNRALAEVEIELASVEGGYDDLNEAEEAALEARIEAALERVEEAVERAVERITEAGEAHERAADAKKRRPRY